MLCVVWVGVQSVRVSSPRYRGHILKWYQVFLFRVATDAFGVSWIVDRAACVPSVVSGEEGKLFEGELESGFLYVCWEAIRA